MFYGEFAHALDRKGRLIIPARFREVFREHYVDNVYVTRGLDRCLFLYPEEEWRAQEAKLKTLPVTSSEARKFNRLFFAGASEVAIDKQGRLLVPKYLKEYAGIKKDVVIIGVSNRIEIWSQEQWQQFYNGSKDSFEEIAERLTGA